ncbi:MAG TPA: radical SAM family heme chaperone HemW [Parafilimonas sp.]|nr:radical SAM family heme chaperone HemW [Parafilimonas sp.]
MAGIYIHIPFCKKACYYCNFHFSTSQNAMQEMVNAICKEASLRNDYLHDDIATIYFGGGTPSLLQIENLKLIIDKLCSLFKIDADVEITLEANPDDISKEKLLQWKQAGINRLSIGVQSFFDDDLKWMNRAHNAEQAYKSILLAKEFGFDNITIDLIYGTPTLTDENWLRNIEKTLQLNIPHLSCYALTVETNTALHKMIHQHKKQNVDAEKQSRHFEMLIQQLNNAGYEHYEISNFAKSGFRSKHNSSYWQGKPYLGLGPSAHSYNGDSRQWNVANNALYIKSIDENILPFEKETLSSTQKINEYIMTSLRTIEGLSLQQIKDLYCEKTSAGIFTDAQKFIQHSLMKNENDFLILTDKGKLFADGIAADLFRT